MKPQYDSTKLLRDVNRRKLLSYLRKDGGDGWTIWKASKFTDMGFHSEDLPVQTYHSDRRDPKSTIYGPDGQILSKLDGVYGLTFLRRLAHAVGADTHTGLMGRGFEAQALTKRILGKLERKQTPTRK